MQRHKPPFLLHGTVFSNSRQNTEVTLNIFQVSEVDENPKHFLHLVKCVLAIKAFQLDKKTHDCPSETCMC